MHQLKGKFKYIYVYILLFFILSSINNYNFILENPFKIKKIDVSGLDENNNIIVEQYFDSVLGKNILYLNTNFNEYLDQRNDLIAFSVDKIYPNKIHIKLLEADILCAIVINEKKIFLGNNGKIIDFKSDYTKVPIVYGSSNINKIFETFLIIKKSDFKLSEIEIIKFFKSGRFDIKLKNEILIKYPIDYSSDVLKFSNKLLNNKKFEKAKIIDLRIKDRVIKYEK